MSEELKPCPFCGEKGAQRIVTAKWPDAAIYRIGQNFHRKYAVASLIKNDYLGGWKRTESAAWEDAATRLRGEQ